MGRILGCALLLLAAVASSNAGDKPSFTVERCWVDYDPSHVVNFVEIELRYQKPVSRRQAQEDLMALLHREMYEWGLSLDYEQLPLWSAIWQDTAGLTHGLSMQVTPMLVDAE